MKKSHLTPLLLPLFLQTAWASPPNIGAIPATIGIKNNTLDRVSISCRVGNTNQGDYMLGTSTPYMLTAGEAHTFSGTAGDGCSIGSSNQIKCTYTDLDTQNVGYFTLNACENSTPWSPGHAITYSSTVDAQPNTSTAPAPYACTYSATKYYNGFPLHPKCSNGNNNGSTNYCEVEAYFAIGTVGVVGPTYTLTWNNITMNAEKGQIMSVKLASMLKNITTSHTFGKPTISFKNDGNNNNKGTMTIILPPPTNPNPNPYATSKNIGECKAACVSS